MSHLDLDKLINFEDLDKLINFEENDKLQKELSQICKGSERFWKEFGYFYAYYYMGKHAKKRRDIWECEQDLFDNFEEEKRTLEAFNYTYSKDGKKSFKILKAIYHSDFKKAKKYYRCLDTGPREYVQEILTNIDIRFEDFLF